MATYLASFNEATSATASPETITASSEKAALSASLLEPVGARIFDGACAACHGSDSRIASLALNTNMHAATPTNVIGTIHQGILLPVGTRNETMAMPSFARLLYDDAIAALVRYIRARFAPDKAPWQGFERAIAQYTAKKAHRMTNQACAQQARPRFLRAGDLAEVSAILQAGMHRVFTGATDVFAQLLERSVGARMVNATLLEGQIRDAIAQGVGQALMEEFILGLTETFDDYLIFDFAEHSSD